GAAFWLSFGASFILLRIYQSLQEQQHTPIAKNDWAYHQQKIKRATWLLWQSQWKIFIALFPLTMIFFQKVSWLAPFVNLVAIPILGACIVPLNMLAAVVHFIYADLAALLWQIVEIFINILLALLNFFDRAFDASLTAFAFTSLMLVLLCIIIALLLLPKGVLPKSWVIAVIAIIAVSLYQDHRTEIHILDIGQGQAIYLKDAQYHALIDTGGYYDEERFSIGQNVVVPFLLRQGVKQLDDVILSHLDNDHIGALPYIAKDIDIQNIRTNESLKQQIEFQQDDDYQTLLTLPEQLCLAGQHWQLSPNFDVQVLSPNTHDTQLIRQNRNEYSCVLYLTVQNVHGDYRHFLFMGDAGWQTEQEIMQRYPHLPVDVLVVGHHGSRHSSLPEFVAHYRPKLAIASAGFNNRYGHPHQDVVDIFKNLNIPFISTIEQGTIRFAQHKQTAQWTWSAYRQQLPWLQREQTQKHNANE
ncbi:MAG: DNA internalization-related competence protein ComEC/Rec2, partial [Acinetobacter sp.]|nr:DNA internalization-related competence protein ComEC/Rec2 [Acinetobacter sp.]